MSGTSPPMPSYFMKRWDGKRSYYVDARLEIWDDPTPRESEHTLQELCDAWDAATMHRFSMLPKPMSREEGLRRSQEHDRKSLMIALQVYAKQHNMQPGDIELVEVKERNLIDEYGKGFVHFNFLAKGLDGKCTTFFAEVHPNLKDEQGVYLCTPLKESDRKPTEENEQALCYGCKDRAKDLVHPTSGGFLGGHEDIGFPFMEESDDECYM